ncbi:General alpha-glucoside permease [Ceratocystis fimbriata CBS 114723]|uniref:General alpha-glucoside permease n=1 Tax=Ceratocystis fimbriata CBS 114723 TaxID=1035309 RepID=A0A2C5X4V1_9PEZI|nr:General alpha-glucoside permease [Ceratocystis fimbriata CBS 114723]
MVSSRSSSDGHSPPTPIRPKFIDPDVDPLNEESPLLSPASPNPSHGARSTDFTFPPADNASAAAHHPNYASSSPMSSPPGHERNTKSVWYLILLTISIGGLQIAWSVELSNGSPYLLSLGLSKSLMALVWIAGPLSGTLVQPYVGMLSDNCRLPWGKRKPFMLGGTIATVASLLFLAWTKEIVMAVLGGLGFNTDGSGAKNTIIVVAVIGVYVLDFAINTVQAAIRAFIVDCAPAHQQEAANAMASRITGVGNIVGYLAGYVELQRYVPWLGSTQFQGLCAIASIFLASTVCLSIAVIPERDPRLDGKPPKARPGLISFFIGLFHSIRRLPAQIKRVCLVQLFSWIGWFPFLFYTSSYIGELYVEPFLEENPNMSDQELEKLYEEATRIGTLALFVNSIVTLLTNVFLPFFIAPTYDKAPMGDDSCESKPMSALDKLRIRGFTLKRAWFISLVFFALTLLATLFVHSVKVATVLVGSIGFTWALTLWAPWAIISAEISRRDALIRERKLKQQELASQWFPFRTPQGLGNFDNTHSPELGLDEAAEHDEAGVILGIHNMSIAAPQIIANITSSVIFSIWQKPRGTPGDRSMTYVFALGSIFVLIAAAFVFRINDGALEERANNDIASGSEGRRLLSSDGPFGIDDFEQDTGLVSARSSAEGSKKGSEWPQGSSDGGGSAGMSFQSTPNAG